MHRRVFYCLPIALVALVGVAGADQYLEFTQTVRSNKRLVADYSHKIWIGAQNARVDDSNAVTWLIRRDLGTVYRLDHRDHSGAEVTRGHRRSGEGCTDWELEGEVGTETVQDWASEVRTYVCAEFKARQQEGEQGASPPRLPILDRMRRQKVKIWTGSEISIDPDPVFATLSGAGIWSGLASIWASLPEPRQFPVQIETQIAQIQTVYRLVKLEEVEVEPGHYDVPPGYGIEVPETEAPPSDPTQQ